MAWLKYPVYIEPLSPAAESMQEDSRDAKFGRRDDDARRKY